LNVKALGKRLKHVNTVICEQIYAWFRGHARVLNEMRATQPASHQTDSDTML
jgi:hypothetical protein